MGIVLLGSVLKEEKRAIKQADGAGLNLIGVSNEYGLQISRADRIADLSRYKPIEMNWFAYNPMRVNVGSIGFAFKEEHIGIVSPDYVVFSCKPSILPEYLLSFLKSNLGLEAIEKNASGAVRKRLYFSDLARISLFLPDLEEQIRIVEKAKRIDNLRKEIHEFSAQNSLISQLKQSILQEAIEGKLTSAWRLENPDTEPATALLHRIKAEKQKLIKEKKLKPEKPLPLIAGHEKPFTLPEGWAWCRLGDLCTKTGSGSTPKGGRTAYPKEGIPFLRSQNVYDDGLRYEGLAFISEMIHDKMKGTKVEGNDLLLNITGASIGRCAIVPSDFDTANINQHVAIVRPTISQLGLYLHKVLTSPYFQLEIIRVQTGAGREGLPKNKMDGLLIPLPPAEEQTEIVSKVDTLMQHCRQLETELAQNEASASKLMQAVLKEAFEGKKEPQTELQEV